MNIEDYGWYMRTSTKILPYNEKNLKESLIAVAKGFDSDYYNTTIHNALVITINGLLAFAFKFQWINGATFIKVHSYHSLLDEKAKDIEKKAEKYLKGVWL